MIGVVETDRARIPAVEVLLLNLVYVGHARIPHILAPGEYLYAPLLSYGYHHFEDVEVAVIGRLGVPDDCVLIELRMRRGIVAAMESLVVSLHAVIWKGVAFELPARDAVSICEGGQKERVDIRFLLQDIEYFFGALVQKGNRPDLNADGLFFPGGGGRLLLHRLVLGRRGRLPLHERWTGAGHTCFYTGFDWIGRRGACLYTNGGRAGRTCFYTDFDWIRRRGRDSRW